ncbi:hypothetical protein O9993_03750 [Vibrio lentus]|nr:hypothetical protein [Vibrio lentus]
MVCDIYHGTRLHHHRFLLKETLLGLYFTRTFRRVVDVLHRAKRWQYQKRHLALNTMRRAENGSLQKLKSNYGHGTLATAICDEGKRG